MTRPRLRRTARPLAPGLIVVAVASGLVVAFQLADSTPVPPVVATGCLVVTVAGWLAGAVWASLRRLRMDREADDRLQVLQDRTCLPTVTLLEVLRTEWSSSAGQQALTIDVATGHTHHVWFSQVQFPTGSLVLVHNPTQAVPLDWMPPADVQAAYRHRSRACRKEVGQGAREERRMAKQLAIEIQRMVRTPPAEPIEAKGSEQQWP